MTVVDGTRSGDETRVAEAVIGAVSDHADADEVDLPPLYEAVEPGALDKLFEPFRDGEPRAGGEVAFPYAGYRITVSIGRRVEVTVTDESG